MNPARPFPSLKGIRALVTGASEGIGEAFARELAGLGANLILVARSKEKLCRLADVLSRRHPVDIRVFEKDLCQNNAPEELFRSLQKEGLEVDLLINNAGFGRYGRFEEADIQKDGSMIALNIHALVSLTHLFLPPMLARARGGIINVASTAAFQPVPFLSVYSATKSFVLSFTEGLWGECRNSGVRILCLCPGNTRTAFHETAQFERSKIFLLADACEVARFGLRVFLKSRKPTAVFGFFNRLLASGYRVLPRKWLLQITRFIYDKRG